MPGSLIYPVHLCQPDSQKACGACCGLYNYQDHSRWALKSLLTKRTNLFHSYQGEIPYEEYVQKASALAGSPKLFEVIHNCDYLGFLDLDQKKVGCLLHPSGHQGHDLRRHSFYGAELCAGHFCPSYSYLDSDEQRGVIAVLQDWYLYGLVITDIDLVKEFFHHTQTRLGEGLRLKRFENDAVRNALKDFFRLKEDWPYASAENRLGKYYFSYSEYQIARIEYEKKWGIKPSRFDKILVSLSSEFSSLEDVRRAEGILEEKIQNFVKAYQEG
ncbi:MAG: hypothetical protein ABSE95_14600 [Thermodesulfobacteriota bacterium]